MANTYTWQINALDTNPTQGELADVVYNIHWGLTATSEETAEDGNPYTATSIGTQSVAATVEAGNLLKLQVLQNHSHQRKRKTRAAAISIMLIFQAPNF